MREAGEVVRADVALTDSGRSKGFGFVEFKDPESAELAINSLNGVMVKGREIFVREDRGGPGAGNRVVPTDRNAVIAAGNRLYVGNLTYEVQWQDLKDVMRQAGNVLHADILTDKSGRSRGCGIVEFATTEEANRAIDTLNQMEIMGRKIFIREDREQATMRYFPAEEGKRAVTSDPGNQEKRVYIGNLPFEIAWQVSSEMRFSKVVWYLFDAMLCTVRT